MKNTQNKPLVVLKNKDSGTAFYSMTHKDPEYDYTNEVVGFVDTDAEALELMDKVNGPFHLFDYITKTCREAQMVPGSVEEIFNLCKSPKDRARIGE